ncbi:MAG: hypothetical protein E6Q89_01515 [Bacteroidia bacterium]|nr:MAG: hypothetical protein E6Q89_01515 [Bacteroidia bacterium]
MPIVVLLINKANKQTEISIYGQKKRDVLDFKNGKKYAREKNLISDYLPLSYGIMETRVS